MEHFVRAYADPLRANDRDRFLGLLVERISAMLPKRGCGTLPCHHAAGSNVVDNVGHPNSIIAPDDEDCKPLKDGAERLNSGGEDSRAVRHAAKRRRIAAGKAPTLNTTLVRAVQPPAIHFPVDNLVSKDQLTRTANNFAVALQATQLQVYHSNITRSVQLTLGEAIAVSEYIFKVMLGTVDRRIRELSKLQHVYNSSLASADICNDRDGPDLIRDIAEDVNILRATTLGNVYKSISRNIALTSFSSHWASIQERIVADGDEGRELITYLRRKRATLDMKGTGLSNVSMAKSAISECLGLTKVEFNDLLQDAAVPATFIKKFGKGALLLIPASKTKYRCLRTHHAIPTDNANNCNQRTPQVPLQERHSTDSGDTSNR